MEILWPRANDRLFKTGGHRSLRACLIDDFSVAASGYRTAADELVELLARCHRKDSLTCPIVFCYRQYLELQLKAITTSIRDLTGEDFKRTHRLVKLWSPLRARLIEQGIESRDREALEAVDACIAEMDKFDSGSMTFRYPEFAEFQQLEHQIDLGNLKSVMGRLATFLDALLDLWGDR